MAVLGFTLVYYLSQNAAFASKAIALDQAGSQLDTWLLLHTIHIALALAASALGIWAIHR